MKRKKTIPMILQGYMKPRAEQIKEHALVVAFKRGYAGKAHYDELTRMVNTVMMIGLMQQDSEIVKQGDILKDFVTEIYNRYQAKKTFVLTAQLLNDLTNLVNQYDEFIKQQPKSVLDRAKVELALFENELAEKRKAAA